MKRLTVMTDETTNEGGEFMIRTVIAGLLAAAVLTPVAAADPPFTVTREVVDFTATAPFCSFPTIVHSEGVLATKTYVDGNGNVVREVINVQRSFTITYTNPANGKSISTVLGGPVRIEYHPDRSFTQTITGRERLYNAPGEGVVAKQVGRLVIHVAADGTVTTLFQAGRWDESVFPAVCAYLEG
jgi:hypothetical protein